MHSLPALSRLNVNERLPFGRSEAPSSVTGKRTASSAEVSQANSVSGALSTGVLAVTAPPLAWEKVGVIQNPFLGDIQHYRFSNGQQLYAVHRPNIPLASFGVLYGVGSVDEKSPQRGISHLLEHLIFQSDTRPELKRLKQDLEGTGAKINAYTSSVRTFYHGQYVPSESLKTVISTWGRALDGFSISDQVFTREKDTVLNEINESHDKPDVQLAQKLFQKIWPDKPALWALTGVLGTKSSVNGLSKNDIYAHYQNYYHPKNRKFILVGDFNLPDVLETIATNFNRPWSASKTPSSSTQSTMSSESLPESSSEETRKPQQPEKPVDVANSSRFETVEADVKMSHMFQGLRLDLRRNPDGSPSSDEDILKREMVFSLLSFVLASHRNSRLVKRLVEEDKLATDVSVDLHLVGDQKALFVSSASPTDNLEKVREVITEELERIHRDGVTSNELEVARKNIRFFMANAAEQQGNYFTFLTEGVSSGRQNVLRGEDLKILDTITPEAFNAILKDYFDPKQLYGVAQVPKKEATPKNPTPQKPQSNDIHPVEDSLMDTAMKVTFGGRLRADQKSFKLNGGGELIVEETPGKPLLATSFLFRGENPDLKEAAVPATLSSLMARGTSRVLPKDHQQQLLENGVRLVVSAHKRGLGLSLAGLKESKNALFATLKQYLSQGPAFNRLSELDFIRKQTREGYQSALEMEPKMTFVQAHARNFYPPGHEHGRTPEDLVREQASLTPDQLKQHYDALLRQPGATISVIGDVKADEIKAEIESILAPLESKPAAKISPLPAFSIPQSRVHTVAYRGPNPLDQAIVRRSWVGPGYHTADRYAMVVLNTILSGGLTSRLFRAFRDNDEGLCYSVKSGFGPSGKNLGRFDFTIDTTPDKVPKVLQRFQEEIQKIVDAPPTADEMQRVRNFIRGERLILSQSTLFRGKEVAGHRAAKTPNIYDTIESLLKVTPEDIQRVAKQYLLAPSVTTIFSEPKAFEKMGFPVDSKHVLASDKDFLEFKWPKDTPGNTKETVS